MKVCKAIALFPYKDPDLLRIPQVRWGAQMLRELQTVVNWKCCSFLEANNQNTMMVN